jgi:PilZ domain
VANSIVASAAGPQLPVEIIGADLSGLQFFERAMTVAIHHHGVSIVLARKLALDCEVIVRNPETNEEAVAVVVGRTEGDSAGDVYGLAYLDASADLWHLQIPARAPARIVHLECSGCRSVCTLSLSDIDLEIFATTQELIRPCKKCNTSGIWRETSFEERAKHLVRSPAPALTPESIRSPIEERRQNRRTAIKASACIRFSGMDVIVECENVSKGGFRFKCREEFPEGTRVEAAAPYTKSSTNIFCPAGITYCHKAFDGQFRHGVTYIKRQGTIDWDP